MTENFSSWCKSDVAIAKYYQSIAKKLIICYQLKPNRCYYFNEDIGLYGPIHINEIAGDIQIMLFHDFNKKRGDCFERWAIHELEIIDKLIQKIGNYDCSKKIAREYCKLSYKPGFEKTLDMGSCNKTTSETNSN